MDPRAVLAARNNAQWCDQVCRAHGIDTAFEPAAWFARRRSPPLYPDAVTLREDVTAGDLLARVDGSAGCSIKDSFASVDLSSDGFTLLFEAQWIFREPSRGPAGGPLRWTATRAGNLGTALLLAHDGGKPVARLVASRGAGAVGLTHMFTAGPDPEEVWAGACAAVGAWSPGLPVVGYERGENLRAAYRAGFAGVGPLRVWIKA